MLRSTELNMTNTTYLDPPCRTTWGNLLIVSTFKVKSLSSNARFFSENVYIIKGCDSPSFLISKIRLG